MSFGLSRNRIITIIKPLRSGGTVWEARHEGRVPGAVTDSSDTSVSWPQAADVAIVVLLQLEASNSSLNPSGSFFRAQCACLCSMVWAKGPLNPSRSQYHEVPSRPEFLHCIWRVKHQEQDLQRFGQSKLYYLQWKVNFF